METSIENILEEEISIDEANGTCIICLKDFMDLGVSDNSAVASAKKILEAYNGVFLADVVGLGKTFISAQKLAQQLPGGKLIMILPVLKEYWDEALLAEFRVYGNTYVESMGKLDQYC